MSTPKQDLINYIVKDNDMNPAVVESLVNAALEADVTEVVCNVNPTLSIQTITPEAGEVYNEVIVAAVTPVLVTFEKTTSSTETEIVAPFASISGASITKPITTNDLTYYADAEKASEITFPYVVGSTTVILYYDTFAS